MASGRGHTHVCTHAALTQLTFPGPRPQPSSEPCSSCSNAPLTPFQQQRPRDYIAPPPLVQDHLPILESCNFNSVLNVIPFGHVI